MKMTCPEFAENDNIPVRFTQEGENVSPPLEWSDIPNACKSFAVICEDVDARKFTHWVIYNISPNITALPEGLPSDAKLEAPVLASQGINSFGEIGYDGPMPPTGSGPHRYAFTVYACSKVLEVQPGTEKSLVLDAIRANMLASAHITGRYERVKQKKSEKSSSLRT